jgi:hypothetical protein
MVGTASEEETSLTLVREGLQSQSQELSESETDLFPVE